MKNRFPDISYEDAAKMLEDHPVAFAEYNEAFHDAIVGVDVSDEEAIRKAGETTTNPTALQGCFYGVIHILKKSTDRASRVIAWRTCMTYAWKGIHGWQP